MALFFDTDWFDEKLAGAGLAKPDVARALGLDETEVAEMWKDQREISDLEIKTLALLLGAPEVEVRKRSGLQGTPQRQPGKSRQAGGDINSPADDETKDRLARIEDLLVKILRELKS